MSMKRELVRILTIHAPLYFKAGEQLKEEDPTLIEDEDYAESKENGYAHTSEVHDQMREVAQRIHKFGQNRFVAKKEDADNMQLVQTGGIVGWLWNGAKHIINEAGKKLLSMFNSIKQTFHNTVKSAVANMKALADLAKNIFYVFNFCYFYFEMALIPDKLPTIGGELAIRIKGQPFKLSLFLNFNDKMWTAAKMFPKLFSQMQAVYLALGSSSKNKNMAACPVKSILPASPGEITKMAAQKIPSREAMQVAMKKVKPGTKTTKKEEKCADKKSQCAVWAKRGECTKNPRYMLPNCRRSCKECRTAADFKAYMKAKQKEQEKANKIMKRDTAERAGKAERALKEKTAKRMAIERSSKERSSKERSSKERASKAAKYRVNYAAWTGWLNPSDGRLSEYRQNDSRGGFFISAIGSSHSDWYEDRVFKVVRTRIPTRSDYNRGWTGYLNNLRGYFAYSCPTDMAVAGLYSYHDNRYEDRRWKVACNHFSQLGIRKSGWPGWQTKYGDSHGQDTVSCGHNPIVGISSTYNNYHQDRVWRVQCGTFYYKRV